MQETTITRHRQADDRERNQDLADRFRDLAEQWEHDTFLLSNTGQALAHPAHVAIVGLGDPVVPLILERMRIRGGHWYHALHAITQTNPVPLPTTATSQRSSKPGCVGAGTMDASEGIDELAGLFPKLAAEGFEIVGPHTKRYNCIALAAGDTNKRWDDDGYWPKGATRSASINSL